jgi:DNA-binding response OmpR family regulator
MRTIVILEDEFSLAEVLAATLSDLGFRAYTAANGAQGLKLMAEYNPDLVLLDFMMPILDGPGVLRAMHADGSLSTIPVVMMSSLPELTVRLHCSGYSAFLRKPFAFDHLVATIERALAPA